MGAMRVGLVCHRCLGTGQVHEPGTTLDIIRKPIIPSYTDFMIKLCRRYGKTETTMQMLKMRKPGETKYELHNMRETDSPDALS